jgi:hypothetical protein
VIRRTIQTPEEPPRLIEQYEGMAIMDGRHRTRIVLTAPPSALVRLRLRRDGFKPMAGQPFTYGKPASPITYCAAVAIGRDHFNTTKETT